MTTDLIRDGLPPGMHRCPQTGLPTPDLTRRGKYSIQPRKYYNRSAKVAASQLRSGWKDPEKRNAIGRKSQNHIRRERRELGLCIDCEIPSMTYRCETCNERTHR
jgi:hypothetical protein